LLRLNFILLLLLNITPASTSAQNDLIVLSDSLFLNDVINLGNRDGWRFQSGDDSRWADPDFDDSEWTPLKPSENYGRTKKKEAPDAVYFGGISTANVV
jgi:hypothetical protein